MQKILSLRWRVTVAFMASGVAISVLFVLATFLWGHDIEMRFIEATMGEQLHNVIRHDQLNPETPLPATASMQGFVRAKSDERDLPAYMRGLTPGTYERDHMGREYHIMVEDHGDRRYYVTFDATRLEPLEAMLHNVLVGGSIGFAIVALGLGYWLSGRILTPVTRLAEQVSRSEPGTQPDVSPSDFGPDEVGDLARTFNDYLERLQTFMRREAEFTAHMSHELRNHLFVIRSTAEVLKEKAGSGEQCGVLLDRLQRAIHEMGLLLDVVLILAREPPSSEPSPEQSTNVEQIVREVLESRRPELDRRSIRVELGVNAAPNLSAPESVVRAVVCNMIDGAIGALNNQSIFVSIDESSVTVADRSPSEAPGSPSAPNETQESLEADRYFERHALFNLMDRLCERYGWRFDPALPDECGLQSKFRFNA